MDEQCSEKNRRQRNFFEQLVINLFSDTLLELEQRIEMFAERQERKFKKSIAFSVIVSLGAIYILNAMALFISEYVEKGNWSGYGVVGIVLIVIGLILRK